MTYAVFQNSSYTPVGDISAAGLCMIMFVLLSQTYVHKEKSFKLIAGMFTSLFLTTMLSITYRIMLEVPTQHTWVIYAVRIARNITLSSVLLIYIRYLHMQLRLKVVSDLRYFLFCSAVMLVTFIADLVATYNGSGFVINETGSYSPGDNYYDLLYAVLSLTILLLVIIYHKRIIMQISRSLIGVNLISIAILLIEGMNDQTSYTSVACMLPVIGLVFMFQSNPYDVDTGAVSEKFFYADIDKMIEKHKTYMIISCVLPGFMSQIKSKSKLLYEFYSFMRKNIKNGMLYQFSNDRLVVTFAQDSSTDSIINKMIADFENRYREYKLDYKILYCSTNPEIGSGREYIKLFEYTESLLPMCTQKRLTDEDIDKFYSSGYILSELKDISRAQDLNDPRVLVYCQPVYNLTTGTYDTAEALMRLKLDKCGMVFPDTFIPLAEQHGYIHMLSLIILNKTCRAIHDLMEKGYLLQRISVNFSAIDIRYENFCSEVCDIIRANDIPFSKIAVEITESRSESDFNLMKQRVLGLRELGIKFYLDDFGTGYSNFERIMEIPFDIIKFDRSMLLGSVRSEASNYMVCTFAEMFKRLNYSVLFEGVENDVDEAHCVQMKASYLQGYKYSKPIPIERLTEFFECVPCADAETV